MTGRLRSPLAVSWASSHSNGLLKSFPYDIIIVTGDTLIGSWGIFFLPFSHMSEILFGVSSFEWIQSPAKWFSTGLELIWSSSCLFQVKVKVKSLSRVRLFVTPWTVAYQAPPSMGFSRQEYWSRLPFPSPGDLPDPGIEPWSPAFQADTLTSEPPGKSC